LVVDSGNGAHLIYKIKLENNETNVHLLRSVLKTLADEFDTDKIKIDKRVYNPARLVKIAGTRARKGKKTDKRPHRVAKILSIPKSPKILKKRFLEIFAPKIEVKSEIQTIDNGTRLDVEAYLKHYEKQYGEPKEYKNAILYPLGDCLFNKEHKKKASIIQRKDGTLIYQCFHNSCLRKTWAKARLKISGADKLNQFLIDNPQLGNEKKYDDISITTASRLIKRHTKEEPLIKGLLEQRGILLIHGPTGLGKTMISMNIALNLANPPVNNQLWSQFEIMKSVKTIFIQSENGTNSQAKRLNLMTEGNERYKKAI